MSNETIKQGPRRADIGTRLAVAGALLASAAVGGVIGSQMNHPASGEPTGSARPTPGLVGDRATAVPTAIPTTDGTIADESLAPETREITFSGFPVEASNVDTAKGVFKSPFKVTRAFAADPGGLLVGPDFGSKSANNPYGENSQGWDAMYGSEGHIQPISPVSQDVLHYEGPYSQNLPEGGFAILAFGQGTLQFGNEDQYVVELPHQDDNTYLVVVRGYYGDNKQNTDKNDTITVTDYVPGHALAMMLQAGNSTNTAFWSGGQLMQVLETSHSAGTNTGDGGSSKVTIVYADANTGAYDVLEQTEGRFKGGDSPVTLVESNWQK